MSTAQKISQLTTAGPLTGAELVPIVQTSGTLQTTVSTIAAFAVVSIVPVVSALGTQIAQVSAIAAANTTAITSVQADVSALTIRTASVSAVTSVNSAAITSINNVVSALDVRVSVLEVAVSNIGDVSAIATLVSAVASLESTVSALVIQTAAVSALTSVNSAAITSVNNVVSALEVRVSTVSAAVSALQIQVAAVSALTSVNAAAITSINNTVSVLEVRVSSVSANTSVNAAAITSINAVISALNVAVSADVSAKVNRIGDFMDSVQYIEFNTSTSFATSVGRLTWDITHGTLDLGLIGGNANLLLGQREVVYCYNNSGATILKGKVVQVTGASGQRLTIDLAQANSDLNSLTVLGVALENVSVNSSGFVATDGVVNNVDTSNFTDGQIVFLSPVSAGELTATKPVAPQHMVQIGYVVKGGSVGGGSIYAKVQNGYELGELHDVKTSASASIANNEVLAYNTSAGVWTNSTVLLDVQASVSVLNIAIAAVSANTSALSAQIAAVSASVSALQVQVNAVSAALTSTNNVVSALEVRVSTVSAAAAATQTQVNAVSVLVSALDVRVAAVSASVSALQVQVNNVSSAVSAALVSVGQRVLKAGDTMTGALNISTSADAQAVSVAGYATFSSRVSISAGFYTGTQNHQDTIVQRPSFQDYGLVVVAKGSVSATASLDLTEGNYFEARAAGSTTFVFANPPVSVSGAAGRAAGGFVLELQNGGAATVTWPSTVDWPGGTAPTLTASGFDVIVCITDDGGTNWRCVQSMKDSK
jgi:hypothetical protein